MDQIIFSAVKGAIKIFKEYKKGIGELSEYQDDAEELYERVECVLPIIESIEGRLQPDFTTSLQLAKRYIESINTCVSHTKQYVQQYSGKVGGLKLLASKAISMVPLSTMGLNDSELSAAEFIQQKFKGTTPEKNFDKFSERLLAAVGQLNLAISTQLLLVSVSRRNYFLGSILTERTISADRTRQRHSRYNTQCNLIRQHNRVLQPRSPSQTIQFQLYRVLHPR